MLISSHAREIAPPQKKSGGGDDGFRLHCINLPLNLHHKYNSNTNIYISVKFLSDSTE